MAVISDMSQPLGFAVGNALEVKEAIDTLRGEGPRDLTELCLTLGSYMVLFGKKATDLESARRLLEQFIADGTALQKFKAFLESQGGDSSVVDEPEKLPQAKYKISLLSETEGYISEMSAEDIGLAAMLLGAGRAKRLLSLTWPPESFCRKKSATLCRKEKRWQSSTAIRNMWSQLKETLRKYKNIQS